MVGHRTAVILGSWLLSRNVWGSLVLGGLLIVVVGFGLWAPTMNTLAIVVTAVILALLIGIPIGILMAEFRPVNAVVRPLLDVMQTMPSFVYLIPAMMLLGLGKVPAVLATWIYAAPPIIRLTHLGVEQVPADVQERMAYSATRWQLLKEVRLPLAMPSLLAGVNQTTMMALTMVVVASMIGARGVGEEVLLSINRMDIGRDRSGNCSRHVGHRHRPADARSGPSLRAAGVKRVPGTLPGTVHKDSG